MNRKELTEIIKGNWPKLFPFDAAPSKVHFLLKSGFRKDVVFVFADHKSTPIGVGYYTSEETIVKRVEQQFSALSSIQRAGSYMLQGSVPKPLLWEKSGAHWFLLLGVVAGDPMTLFLNEGALKKNTLRDHLKRTSDWLVNLHVEFGVKNVPLQSIVIERGLGDELQDLLSKCPEARVPKVLKHGDFQPSNILLNKTDLFVVDWEYAELNGLPLYDFYHLLVHCYKRISADKRKVGSLSMTIDADAGHRNIPGLQDFKEVFFEEGSFSSIAKEALLGYCHQINFELSSAVVLFYLFVAEYKGKAFMLDLLKEENNFIFKRNT